MRRLFPGLQLTVDVTTLSPNAASVALSWEAREQRDFAGIAIDPGDMIGRLDLVRIERGLIVERRSSGALGGQLDAFPALSLDLPGSLNTLVARVRQISLKGDYEPTTNRYGHLLLVDLSGEAFLEVLRPAALPAMEWKAERGQVAGPATVETGQIVTLSQMVQKALLAAQELEQEGISAEVIDLRTLVPLDVTTVVASVKKTGRLLIADEDYLNFGLSGEISAIVAERLDEIVLKAPIKRLAVPGVPIPYSRPLEQFVIPQTASIVEAARGLIKGRVLEARA